MSGTVATSAYLSVGGTDISTYCETIDLDEPTEVQDDTTFGNTARKRAPGLKDWTIRGTLHADFHNSLADDYLAGLNGTAVAIEFRPNSAAVGVDNPKRTGTGILTFTPIQGMTPGQIIKAAFSIVCSNGTPLTRAEA